MKFDIELRAVEQQNKLRELEDMFLILLFPNKKGSCKKPA